MERRPVITSKPRKKTGAGLAVLFADDEKSLQELMRQELPRMGHRVTVCPDGTTAVAALQMDTFDCAIVDLDMPGPSGIDVIARAKELAPETETVILTGKSSTESAIAALRHNAFDYLTKPCKLVEIEKLLKKVEEKRELARRCRALEHRVARLEGSAQLVGDSPGMKRVRMLISKVAPSDATVLILGETGTGKELVARSVHEESGRSDQPFIAVNCGALPENLIESELFGHRKGSFTGAEDNREGLFQVANGGTLFLDEIGELPRAMQAKLLRVLESGEIRRVGENTPSKVDVRIVCATHRDLPAMVAAGDFREDLMYRINTFEIHLPPVRDRIDDIGPLAEHLLRRFRRRAATAGRRDEDLEDLITPESIERLCAHVWPGNVRELANVLEHATILSGGGPITPDHLPPHFDRRSLVGPAIAMPGPITLEELESQAIHAALDRHDGNKPRAAEELGISLKTLYNKLSRADTAARSA
jgi:two-component system NtrC family response regulator